MKKFLKVFRTFLSKKMFMSASGMAMMLTMLGTVALNAIVYESLPNWNSKNWRGFYYWLDMADYPNLLQSNMPLDIMIGYIVADSAARVAPFSGELPNVLRQLNPLSDTGQYVLKYWYLMNEYDPLRFLSLRSSRKYPTANTTTLVLHSAMRNWMSVNPLFAYVSSDYILHVHVNNTVHIDTANTDNPDGSSATIAYCKILDTLKGRKFPSLSNAIFYNGERPTAGDGEDDGVIGNTYAEALFPSITPDIVFSYRDLWQNGYGGPTLYNPRDGHWVKPNREYIVFLELRVVDAVGSWDPIGSPHKIYYSLWPFPHRLSYSMYPVEDGYVLDKYDALGFGKKVPVEEFKQNIRNKINEVKNFGE